MIARLVVAVMAADGRITSPELHALERLGRLGLGGLADLVREEIDRAIHELPDLEATCAALEGLGPEAAAVIFAALASIASSDRQFTPPEDDMLQTIADLLGIDPDAAAHILASAHDYCMPGAAAAGPRASEWPPPDEDRAVAHARELLGVGRNATAAQIEAAYLRLVQHYNPAKVVDLGSDFTQLAVHRLADVTTAYELVTRSLAAPVAH